MTDILVPPTGHSAFPEEPHPEGMMDVPTADELQAHYDLSQSPDDRVKMPYELGGTAVGHVIGRPYAVPVYDEELRGDETPLGVNTTIDPAYRLPSPIPINTAHDMKFGHVAPIRFHQPRWL